MTTAANANLAAYAALLTPGDTVLAMSLPHGGHLTHGSKVNFSGKWFNTVGYGVHQDTELIDYDRVRSLAREHRPKMIIAGATAYSRLIDFAAFREIAGEVGAYLMVDAAHFIGLVAGKAIPSPVPYADVVCFTTHKVLRGPRGGMIVCKEELAAKIDKAVFPFTQGGPLMHSIAGKAVALKQCLEPSYQQYAQQVITNAHTRRGPDQRGHPHRHRRHRHAPDARRPARDRCHRQGRGRALRTGTHRAEQERDSVRPAAARDHIGHPRPHAGGHHVGMTDVEMKDFANLIATAVRDESAAGEVGQRVMSLVSAHPAYPRG